MGVPTSDDRGVFTLSLDTELAWGTFDVGRVEQHERAYRNTPDIIESLCTLFDEYEVSATWALVSHLLTDCGGDHAGRTPPDFEWVEDWFGSMPCASGLDKELWSAPWLVDRLQACETVQDIGLHGATHMQLGAEGCSRQNAIEELGTAVETLEEHGIDPKSFVFPRNDVGHLDVLADHGIAAYRGVDARWYERQSSLSALRPPLRFLDEASRTAPPVVEPVGHDDLVEIPGSQVFRPTHGGWQYTPSGSSVARAKKGLRRAAQTGDVFHLWFHPFNLGHRPSTDLGRLEEVLAAAAELVDRNALVIRPMAALADS